MTPKMATANEEQDRWKEVRAYLQDELDSQGLSVEELANRAGISKAALYNFLNDVTSHMLRSKIRAIAGALNLGVRYIGGIPEFSRMTPGATAIPILKLKDLLKNNGALTMEYTETIVRPIGITSKDAYAISIEDESMSPAIPLGAIAVVDPDRTPKSGDLAVIKSGNMCLLRQVTFHGDKVLCKAYNPSTQDELLDRQKIDLLHRVVWVRL